MTMINYPKATILQIVIAFCLFLVSTITKAETVNRIQIEDVDISIIFSNEIINNEPQWRYGLIDVELKKNWKTYWKNSGNSGFSPKLKIENNIKNELLFSVPHLLKDGKDWAYIYKDHTQIVFRIAANEMVSDTLKGSLAIGICDTICMPFEIPFIFDKKSSNGFVNKLKIQTALNSLPHEPSDNFYLEEPQSLENNIEIALHLPNEGENAELFLYTDKAQIGIAKLIRKEKNKIVFLAPILSGKIDRGQKIDFIAKYENKSIFGSVNNTP